MYPSLLPRCPPLDQGESPKFTRKEDSALCILIIELAGGPAAPPPHPPPSKEKHRHGGGSHLGLLSHHLCLLRLLGLLGLLEEPASAGLLTVLPLASSLFRSPRANLLC